MFFRGLNSRKNPEVCKRLCIKILCYQIPEGFYTSVEKQENSMIYLQMITFFDVLFTLMTS